MRDALVAQLAQHGRKGIAAGHLDGGVGRHTADGRVREAAVALPQPERRARRQDQQQDEGDDDEAATALEC